jgi:hypothetical protein
MMRSLRLAAEKDSRSTRSEASAVEKASSTRNGATANGLCSRGRAKNRGAVRRAPPTRAIAVRPPVGTARRTRSGGGSSKSASTASRPSVRKPIHAIAAKYAREATWVEEEAAASVRRNTTSSASRASLGRLREASLASAVKSRRCDTERSSPSLRVAVSKPSHRRYTTPATFSTASETPTGRPDRARHHRKRSATSKRRMPKRLEPPVQRSGSGAIRAAGAIARK